MINNYLKYDVELWKNYDITMSIEKTNITEANEQYQILVNKESYYFYKYESHRDKDFEKLKQLKQCQPVK